MLEKLENRLGPLWWYTIILFIAQRFGDVLNAFIGLWLVPRYVPQEELGAVLPLSQVGGVLALPLSVLAVTFLKYVNAFAIRGEYGKVKSLIRDVLILVVVLFVGIILYARLFLPLVFERMRVEDGRLGMLIVVSGVLGSLAVFFTNALQALKKFKLISIINLMSAPLRLVTLLICLPIRALSGYFVGQIVPLLYSIGVALFGLKDIVFNKALKVVPYWRQNGRDMIKFSAYVALGSLFGSVRSLVETFVIRHRLPDIDSAGYYMISRFAEIGSYVGLTMMFVLFPLGSEQYERGDKSQKLVVHAMGGALGSGLLLAGGFWLMGKHLLNLIPMWRTYVDFAPHLTLLTVIFTLHATAQCFMSHEIACRRFGFYWYTSIIAMCEAIFLYCITGFSFFEPWVPASWIAWVEDLNPGRIGFVLKVMFWAALLSLFAMFAQLMLQRFARSGRT
jgi:O-antigen/teichoic acid export membrane protein